MLVRERAMSSGASSRISRRHYDHHGFSVENVMQKNDLNQGVIANIARRTYVIVAGARHVGLSTRISSKCDEGSK